MAETWTTQAYIAEGGDTPVELAVLHEICLRELHCVVAYEQLSVYAHYPNIYSVRGYDLAHHPLYRTLFCRHAHCSMGDMCVHAHSRDELRTIVQNVYRIRLTRGNRDLLCLTTRNDVVFRSKEDAYAFLTTECLYAIDNGVAYDAEFPALESVMSPQNIQRHAVYSSNPFHLCMICHEAPRSVRFGCGHSCMREGCLGDFLRRYQGRALCPLCRTHVVLDNVTAGPGVARQDEFIPPNTIPNGRHPEIAAHWDT